MREFVIILIQLKNIDDKYQKYYIYKLYEAFFPLNTETVNLEKRNA